MSQMNPTVDRYFIEGCMRCQLGGTPDCKVHRWQEPMAHLRMILLDSGLTEERKWGVPCYTFQGANVMLLSAFNDYCALSFFKGSLLEDPHGLLVKPGENSQATRYLRFTRVEEVIEREPVIRAYIKEALALEKAGRKVEFKQRPEPIPEELEAMFAEDPALQAAFEALTPGRQRGYILHFSQPKQAKTRLSRIEKCVPKIMEGKGFHDR